MTQPDDLDDGAQRGGVMHLRAKVARLERELAQERAGHEEARRHARKLSAFIKDRVGNSAWSHVDVLKLVAVLYRGLSGDLRARMAAMAAGKAPASHVLYRRAVEAAIEDTASRVRSAAVSGMHRPDMVKPDMQQELFDLFDAQK